MSEALTITLGVTTFMALDILAMFWLALPWRCPLIPKATRVRILTEKIADLRHERGKWGWADKPSDTADRDRREARLCFRLARLRGWSVTAEEPRP